MKALLIVALLLVASPVAAQEAVDAKPIAAFIAGSSFDLATTLYDLQASPNVREGNPLLSGYGTPGLVVIKSAYTAAMALALVRLTRQGHPTAARWIGYVGGVALSGLALNNLRVLHDVRGR